MDRVNENLDVALMALRQKLEDPASIPDGAVIIPLHMLASKNDHLPTAAWRTLEVIRTHGGYARLQDLADALGRGKHRVSKDVDALSRLGLVTKAVEGRNTRISPVDRPILVQ